MSQSEAVAVVIRASEANSKTGRATLRLEIPDARAFHIDSEEDFSVAEALLAAGVVCLPWLDQPCSRDSR